MSVCVCVSVTQNFLAVVNQRINESTNQNEYLNNIAHTNWWERGGGKIGPHTIPFNQRIKRIKIFDFF